jgi:Leucine-rich repeat (LRR) protein
MYGGPSWLVNGWLDRIGPAKLTAVKLEHQAATGVDLARLAACTQLQELVLRHVSKHHWGVRKGRALSRLLLQLTSLTRFEVLGARGVGLLDGQVPPGVWGLAQLRALDLNRSWQFLELPSGISSLRQLTFLGVTGSRLQELPHQLGAWLPQLQVREADDTALEAIPHGLSRLTRLHVNRCDVRNVSAGSRLVSLQALHISGSYLQPRYGALSNLSKLLCLRTLMITNYRGRATGVPGPLPCLRVLQLAASSNHVQVASQLVGSGQQLTRLELCGVGPDQVEVLGQLGVLPVLQEFALSRSHVTSLAPAGNWLQQQPQLTSLSVDCLETNVERCQLGPLPIGLQRLITTGLDVWQDASVRESLVQLSGLRVLNLYSNHIQAPQLPSWWLQWVLSLLHLEELRLSGVSAPYTWRAAVAKLPLLRDVHACTSPYMAELN